MSILHQRDAKAGTLLRKVLSDVEAVEACVAKSIALEAERDRLKASNEELMEKLANVLAFLDEEANTQNEGAKAWPILQRIQGSAIILNARAALAKARQS